MQYYAITKFNTTKENPFTVARYHDGSFEMFSKAEKKWNPAESLAAIFTGDYDDHEEISEEKAAEFINSLQ